MGEVSASIAERSRKNEGAILRAIATVGQNRMAERLGLSESTVSRMVANDIKRLADILAALELAVMSDKAPRVDPEVLAALQVLAARGAQSAAINTGFGDL